MKIEALKRPTRNFIPEDLVVNTWEAIEPYFNTLKAAQVTEIDALLQWMANRSELTAAIEDEYRWRYIRQSCDTENKAFAEAYEYFVEKIAPQMMVANNELDKLVVATGLLEALEAKGLNIYVKHLENSIELFKEENIPLLTEMNLKEQEYGVIIGRMTIEHEGQELTLYQAAKLLQSDDRALRKTVFDKIAERRLQDKDILDNLFDELLVLRSKIAKNAGFENYRDYKLKALGRFDYGVEACEAFHEAIKNQVVPVAKLIQERNKKKLGYDSYRPYDADAPLPDENALSPFTDDKDLVEKTIHVLQNVDDYFAWCLATMDTMGHLDLSSRKGKSPGGYNMTLPEIGVPFIFMNASGTQRDVVTMVHEGGHAVHSFLMRDLKFDFEKEISSEIAELASMSMELFTLEEWKTFYPNENDFNKAKMEQLEKIVSMLPWIAIVDKFQHWIYTHEGHTVEERNAAWMEIFSSFGTKVMDWSGYEETMRYTWQKQLHIFEVPFYYIEYGIAQLGALGMWMNFRENKEATIAQYKQALALGYTKPLPETYAVAGVPFDFSEAHIQKLMDMMKKELGF
ncbi:MAG: M3 family oligoendopeptidase [Chitinophagales bacterium]|nr:M3 family oligoendopeptidase [Chitinophagales bacterium]